MHCSSSAVSLRSWEFPYPRAVASDGATSTEAGCSHSGIAVRRLVLAIVVAAGFTTYASAGQAEDVDAINKRGIDLRRQGRDAEALVEFQRAARTQDSPRASAQIALAEQALGLWLDASTHLGLALSMAGDPASKNPQRNIAPPSGQFT